jgi:TPR repeat protein
MAGLEDGVAALQRQDYQAARHALLPLAEAGRPEAQFYLGLLCKNGWGVAKDEPTAVRWWRLAAEQGLADAQYNLGLSHRRGEGTRANFREAAKWLSLAAQQGDPSAACALGHAHYAGLGVPQNLAAAARWFRIAARDGDPVCQHNLGLAYLRGEGVRVDYVQAYAWFDRAATKGFRDPARGVDSAKNRDWVARHLSEEQLARARELARSDPAEEVPEEPAASPPLFGTPVARAQTVLMYLGYDRGPADGHLGEDTREAIRRFQRDRRLPVTGDLSLETLQLLERASPVLLDPAVGPTAGR